MNKNRIDLQYRNANVSDAQSVTELVNLAYRTKLVNRGWTNESDLVAGNRIDIPKVIDLISQSGSVFLLCHKQQQLVACVHLVKQTDSVYLGMLAVLPELQGQGIGGQILQYAEQYAWTRMQAEVIIMEVISQRPELIAFYQRRGYLLDADICDYPIHLNVGQPLQENLTVQKLVKQKTLC